VPVEAQIPPAVSEAMRVRIAAEGGRLLPATSSTITPASHRVDDIDGDASTMGKAPRIIEADIPARLDRLP